ncbi:MAG: 50S ribosomal protein L11 methyltransferase [Xenococcaceae cyanobacterium MO_234.B1]|nr:50S ribosomal protein L11 methyltransferase [Xenococcaceae cyanobacterium MO_234.B1]
MSDRWWEIVVICDPVMEESVYWQLEKFGCSGTATEKKPDSCSIKAYLSDISRQSLDISNLSLWLEQDALILEASPPQVDCHLIDDEDWASSWKQHWQPQSIGGRFLVYPAWLDPPQNTNRLLLRLDPGAAFGTGTHPTTQLCLESLEMRLSQGAENQTIADIGCGSGILSLGALLLGAKEVHAIDTDPLAVKTTKSNLELNNINPQKLKIFEGSIDKLPQLKTTYDGIVCNILADTILGLFPQLNKLTHDKSWAILSGILVEQADKIADLVEGQGWTIAALWKRGEWCCFNVRRSEY